MIFRLLILAVILPTYCLCQDFRPLNMLNSPFRETNLSITPNGKYLYFMSERGGQNWSTFGYPSMTGNEYSYDGDIWFSIYSDGQWKYPKVVDPPVNTSSGEDEPSISMDGQTVYFQSWRNDWVETGGPYYQAELDGVAWKNVKGLGGNIHRFFLQQDKAYDKFVRSKLKNFFSYLRGNYLFGTDGMAVSPDGSVFIVAATNYIESDGNFDLFISRKSNTGSWSYPLPLSINTSSNEITVFIASDNETVYFASDRPGGSGGYDIYKTSLLSSNQCGEVINIGAPYNSSMNDYGFIVNSLDDKGYLVRNGDIYETYLTDKAKAKPTFVVNGKVMDGTGVPLRAKITYSKRGSRRNLGIVKSNSHSGEFSFSFPSEKDTYQVRATLQDGRQEQRDFTITDLNQSAQYLEFIFPSPDVKEISKIDVKGKVVDDNGRPLKANIQLLDQDRKLIEETSSDGNLGDYGFSLLRKAGTYRQIAKLPDGRSQVRDFKVDEQTESPISFEIVFPTPEPEEPIEEVARKLDETNLKIGEVIPVDKLYFDADTTTIQPSSYPVLDQIAYVLNKRPNLRIEVGGHTNGLPPHEYCDQLSAARAKSVYDYLIQKEVPEKQLTYKGYGKRRPLYSNNTEIGRQKNQRVEITVLELNNE